MTKIALRGKIYEIRLLSAAEMLECLQMAQDCLKRISSVDGYDGLAEALAENSSLACCCLYQNGKRAFSSPDSVLSRLGIDELCDVFEEYGRLSGESETERGINKSFSAKTGGRNR